MNLLKDNLKTLYLRFLIPSLGSAMVMSIYTLTDAIVIGKGVGSDDLAALSITTPLLCILISRGILFGVGGSVQMSVNRGIGDTKKANRFFTLSFIVLALLTVLLWITYVLGMPVFLRMMGANETLYPYAHSYMHYINLFLPIVVFSNFIAIFIRADNDPNRAMAGVILGGVVNIVLDIVFVFPLNMGIAGAALASVIGMVIQVLVVATHFLSEKNGLPSFFNEFANGFIAFLPMGVNLLASYYFQAILCVKQSLCISLCRNIVLSSVCILVFPTFLGANSLWVVMPVVELVVLGVSMGFLINKRK